MQRLARPSPGSGTRRARTRSRRDGRTTGERRSRAGLLDPGLGGQELEQVVQVQVVLVHRAEPAEQPLDRALDGRRRLGEQRQVAERQPAGDRLERDVEVGQGAGEGGDRPQTKPDEVAGRRRAAAGVLVDPRQLPEPVDEVRPEAEQLDLLGVRVGRHERREVVHPPPDRRRPAGEVVAAPAVARVGDERGDRRDRAPRARGAG